MKNKTNNLYYKLQFCIILFCIAIIHMISTSITSYNSSDVSAIASNQEYITPTRRCITTAHYRHELYKGTSPGGSIQGSSVSRTLENMVELSCLIVHGRITGVSYPFTVISMYATPWGNKKIFTEYYIQVIDVFRGETTVSEIPFRMFIGLTDSVWLHLDNPMFTMGGEYIIFLHAPDGCGFDTPGYYYYHRMRTQAVYRRETSFETGRWGAAVFVQYSDRFNIEPIELPVLRDEKLRLSAIHPLLTPEDFRQMSVDALKANIESGFLYLTEEQLQAEIYEILNQNQPSYRSGRIVE